MKTLLREIITSTIVLATFCLPLIVQAGGKVAVWGDSSYGQRSLPNGLDNIKMIAGGWRHSLALKADGTVVAWGYNDGGATNIPPGLTNVVAISAKSSLSLALKADGTVNSWGGGPGTSNLSNITAIAAGWYHWLGLKSDGTIVTAGIGAGSQTPTNVPSGLSNVIAVAAGIEYSVVLKSDGTVVAWGLNSYGQTNVPAGLSNVVAIAAGFSHNLALKSDGTVVTWGSTGEPALPSGLSNVIAIAAGAYHSMALKADGTVVSWWASHNGLPDHGQTIVPAGLSNVKAISAGEGHSMALVFDGPPIIVQQPESANILYRSNVVLSVVAQGMETLTYRWFLNGNLVNNTERVSGAMTSALMISNAQFADIGSYTVIVSNQLGTVSSVGATLTVIGPPTIVEQPVNRTVRAGTDLNFNVVASGTPPLRYQWNFQGSNIPGATNASLPFINAQPTASGIYFVRVTNLYGSTQSVQVTLTVTNSAPYILSQPTNRTGSLGGSASFAVSARGSLPLRFQWRFNGTDILNATNTALELSNLRFDQTGFYTVAISNSFGETNSAKAFLNVTQISVWGDPFNGNTNIPTGLSNLVAIAAGGFHIVGLKDDGTVKVWLANPGYIFGSTAVTNVPSAATNVTAIAAGRDHNLALRSNGTVLAWGSNSFGQTNVPAGLSNVISVAAGSYRSYAVKSDGTVASWGSSLLPPVGLSNIVKISSGPSHSLALKRDGSVLVWGSSGITSYLTNLTGLSNAIDIAAGSFGNLALRKDGTVWISPGSRILLPTNLSNRVAIAVNSFASMALKQDGTVASSGEFGKTQMPNLSNVTAIAIGGVQSEFGVALVGDGTPRITLNPYSQILKKGEEVQLHARAVGLQPMSYQWQFENHNIVGATNASLNITNMQGNDTGNYRLFASNSVGSVFSATAQLAIPFSTNLASALNATNLKWNTFSSNGQPANLWFAQVQETHDGDTSAQSGAISHNQQSQLSTTVQGPGTLTFWWKVSSEAGYDFLKFSLGEGTSSLASISGEIGWQQKTFSIPTGSHVLRWTYLKDASVSSGRDAGWVDQVVFTPSSPIIQQQPVSQTVEAGSSLTLEVAAEGVGPLNYQWLMGSNELSGATQPNLALPSATRRDSGDYRVRIWNQNGVVMSSNATLRVRVPQQFCPPLRTVDGRLLFSCRDADGGQLLAEDLSGFEAQASTNLVNWFPLPAALTITNGSLLLRDPDSNSGSMRFYRLVEH